VEISPLGREGMAFAKIVAAWSPVKATRIDSLVLPITKRVSHTGEGGTLSNERKECRK
jgi:hypothetical protein